MTQPEENKRADGAYDRSKPRSRRRGRFKRSTDRSKDESKEHDRRVVQPPRGRRRRRRSDRQRGGSGEGSGVTPQTSQGLEAEVIGEPDAQTERNDGQRQPDQPDAGVQEEPREDERVSATEGTAPTPERVSASTPERVSASTPERVSASTPETVSAPAPEGTSAPAPEGVSAPAPEGASAPTPETVSASAPESVSVVGVKFRKSGKVYYFSPNEIDLSPGDNVIVETARGTEFGSIVCGPRLVPTSEIVSPLKPVVRKASADDQEKAKENEEKEKQAFSICLEKIAQHDLPMKLVDVEYTFDRSKLVFYFTADGRVDFRELVKDLASVFRTRIELRQIGVRDEAKMIGGLGCCGRPMCCASFLGDFEPVSIKMAKEQNLSLNPTKISGVCGRLMCCLRYEYEAYKASKHGLPEIGQDICTARGHAKVVDVDILRRLVRLDFGDGEQRVVPADEINSLAHDHE